MLAIGMMSGTSLDGIDTALIEFMDESEGNLQYNLIDFETFNYPQETVIRLQNAMDIEKSDVRLICQLNAELGILYGQAAKLMMSRHHLSASSVSFIANHGQTIYHAPNADFPSTLQLGAAAEIFELTSVPVVSNFREADIAAGGQGAPIVPFTEFVLFRSTEKNRIFVNIGGISNLTVLTKNADFNSITAFDTGPGNMMIDTAMQVFFNKKYDKNGEIGKIGTINETVLTDLMKHEYINRPYPKTTGREDFGVQMTEKLFEKYQLTAEDWVSTLTAFAAKSLAKALKQFQQNDLEVIIGGGGSYNPTLLSMLRNYANGFEIMTQEEFGNSSEAKEAVAMAILGKYTLEGKPNNVPSATGAKHPVILGSVTGKK